MTFRRRAPYVTKSCWVASISRESRAKHRKAQAVTALESAIEAVEGLYFPDDIVIAVPWAESLAVAPSRTARREGRRRSDRCRDVRGRCADPVSQLVEPA